MTKSKSRFAILCVLLTALMLQLVAVTAFAAGHAALHTNAEAVEANARAAYGICSRPSRFSKPTPPHCNNRYNFWLTGQKAATHLF